MKARPIILTLLVVVIVLFGLIFINPCETTELELVDEIEVVEIEESTDEIIEPTVEVKPIEPPKPVTPVEPSEPNEVTEESDTQHLGKFKLTAYCACVKCCGKWANSLTATGTVPTQGRTIAVDPKVIPYGTQVVINGNTYVAEDCGGAIKGNRIDIFFDNHSEALQFGVRHEDVYLARS